MASPAKIVKSGGAAYTINAANLPLGRVATQAAQALRGKHEAAFTPHIMPHHKVVVKNVDRLALTGRKREQMKSWHFTGFPGGMRLIPVSRLMERDPRLVLRRAVRGMLPKNRHRDKLLKNLLLFRGEK